ncbi:MAG: T9SS type A sorting domain-containing protein [Flavipsychrobacter sp.]
MKKLLVALMLLTFCQPLYAQDPISASTIHVYDGATQSTAYVDSFTYSYQGTRQSNYNPYFEGFGADEYTYWTLNSSTNQYEAFQKGINLFDSKGNIIKHILGYIEPTGLDTSAIYDYVYDANDRITSRTYKSNSTSGWYWENRLSYTYDAQGNRTSYLREIWDIGNNNWRNDSMSTYTYTNGKMTGELTQWWWPTTSSWEDISRTAISYNSNEPDSILTEQYHLSSWDTTTLEVYHYDANNNNDTLTIFDYYTSWVPSQRNIYSYDNNHNRLSNIQQGYLKSQSKFENQFRERYSYNTHNLLTLTLIDVWNAQSSQFEYLDGYPYMMFRHYGSLPSGIERISSNRNLKIFPNPASSTIQIQMIVPQSKELLEFAIYDASGKQMRFWRHEPYSGGLYNHVIDVTEILDGLYVIRNLNTGISQQIIITH